MDSLSTSAWRLGVAGCLLVAFLIVLPNADLVMDGHETLVVQTAREMQARGDWLVPYFNDQPRLQKPPMGYWLTGASAWLVGAADDIRPFHGRLASGLAGVALVALTLLLGARLFDRSTALVAGAIFTTSAGYVLHVHDARVDMAYALTCGIVVLGLVLALSADREGRSPLAGSLLMWAGVGLATLAKGPHLPAMLLAGAIAHCALQRLGWRRGLRIFRPLSGLLLAAAIAAPWWLALGYTLGFDALRGEQVSGELLVPRWQSLANPYYLYSPLVWLLPWLALIPFLVRALRREWRTPELVLVCLLYVGPVLGLSLGTQRRSIYIVPALMPAVLALAAACTTFLKGASPAGLARWQRFFVAGHGVVLAALVIFIALERSGGVVAWLALATVAVCVLAAWWLAEARRRQPLLDVLAVAVMAAATLTAGVCSDLFWGELRFERARIAGVVRDAAADGSPFAVWGPTNYGYVYYTGRPVPNLRSTEEVEAMLDASVTGQMLLVAYPKHVAKLRDGLELTVLTDFTSKPGEEVEAVRIRRPAL